MGHQSVWPELRLMLWKVTKKNGTRYGFLGESLCWNNICNQACPLGITRRVGLKLVLPLIKDGVPEDVDSRISGTRCLAFVLPKPDFSRRRVVGREFIPVQDAVDPGFWFRWKRYMGCACRGKLERRLRRSHSPSADRNRCRYWS